MVIGSAVIGLLASILWSSPASMIAGVMAGCAWNLANLWCLSRLLTTMLGPTPARARVTCLLLTKMALYGAAFGVLRLPGAPIVGFSIGFTIILAAALIWVVLHAQQQGVLARSHGR